MDSVNYVRSNGLANSIRSPQWYMLSSNEDDAIFHSKTSGQSAVIQFDIPVSGNNEYWEGHPWLWPSATPGAFKGKWYAPKETIPPEFITDVRQVSTEEISAIKHGRERQDDVTSCSSNWYLRCSVK